MVFKNKLFFSSSKKSETSSPDGSNNSPRSIGSNSPIRSDKKKPAKSKDSTPTTPASTASSNNSTCKQTQVKDGVKKKDSFFKGKETVSQPQTPTKPGISNSGSDLKSKKGGVLVDNKEKEAEKYSVSPILASSLGLNRIKTRSGPLPQESSFSFKGDKGSGVLGSSTLSRPSASSGDGGSSSNSSSLGSGKKKEGILGQSKLRVFQESGNGGDNSDSMSTGSGGQSREVSPNLQARTRLQSGESSSEAGQHNSSWGHSGGLRSSDAITPETYDCDNPKESESPRFQAILRLTSAPRKRFPADIKSFSHELNSKGVRPFPFWKPRGLNNLEEILVVIRAKFDKAKEEVNSDLAIFAADLVGILEKNADSHPEWQETIEDLLVLARSCAMTSPGEFWLQCEVIVQELDDRRQELPPGILKQLHTRMLFILTRCTRLLQFHKERVLDENENVFGLRQSRLLHPVDKRIPSIVGRDGKVSSAAKKAASGRKSYSQEHKAALVRKSYSQEQRDWSREQDILPGKLLSLADNALKSDKSPTSRDRISSWKPLPSPPGKSTKEVVPVEEQNDSKIEPLKTSNDRRGAPDVHLAAAKVSDLPMVKDVHENSMKHQPKISWGNWGDQQSIADESSIICRICEEEVPTLHVEDHLRICAIADRCDQKGLSVDERLIRISETLEKMIVQKDIHHAVGSPDVAKVSNSSVTEESDVLSPKLSDWSHRGSEDMLDCFPEADNAVFMDDLKGLPSMSCKTRFGPKSDQGMATSSAGSMTPRSPLLTPKTSHLDLLLAGKSAFSEHDDLPQLNELADIARCVATTPLEDDRSTPYLLTCLGDLRVVIERRKFDALTVETFGTRIEKLIREKYLQLCELVEDEKVDIASTVIHEDTPLEDDVVRSLRTSPIHSSKDRTSIDDFEIIKPISRGAFGRVFLAKKRATGDLFAIKVLKKADMIRKNAVESILAERDILISVRNPFVVRFFYSFTCRENLYLVMEYLNGGDLYSLLRNLGCLDEDVARVYIAEVVLALEYLHSLRVVHRDLKPDNLLIAHDGHIKLTDFGLSKVGLINSTDDLSGPAVSGTSMLVDDEPQLSTSEHQQERRKKRSAVGTPDYLAPEILLGTGHGTTADWWSVGVILFELIVGIPPFNAEHPQTIFDNILNCKIPWPRVPEEMSPEAQDLIDRLLTEDPYQRLGAGGASEVKQHVFFKDINWDTLARQKAAFVPSSESALDTSYFTSRYSWNTSDDAIYPASDFEDSSDADSLSGSSSCLSNRHDEVGDECQGLAEFESGSGVNYSFSNFSFKNLSQLASINYDILSKGWKDDPPTTNL
ncbi:probable serine/threonine protein kinase IREH1 isoform X1 [Populus nigra]|uniref:probable serine/threonine protein kinase IREH1 isoform X1 n=1 Tax=Populus nigra TaxID=3691 RepID=UPI002B267A26|nr:probable serine/threonine protein kinase IREH1 isoform X1 [Populus nigra]